MAAAKLSTRTTRSLSQRCAKTCIDGENFEDRWSLEVAKNTYDKENSKGIVNLGTAESKLVEDLMVEKLSSLPVVTKESLYYFRLEGVPSFTEALADFFHERFNSAGRVNPDHLTILPGVSSCLDTLAFALADPGEYFLCPYPFYARIENDMADKSKVCSYGIPLTSEMEEGDTEPFQLTVRKIERTYNEAKSKGLVVRGIVLTNPNNPLGVLYSPELLMEILNFAKSHELHVISDEIYALSLFNTTEKFTSILSLENIPDPDRTHMLWGFSKDFGLSGYRCGVVHSRNAQLLKFLHCNALLCAVPYIVQSMLESLIRDKDWLDNVYFPALFKGMRENYQIFADSFSKLGIPIYKGCGRATCFIWANFSKYVKPLSEKGEDALFMKLMDAGVYIVPGSKLGCREFGWFRIVFTIYKEHVLKAVERMEKLLLNMDMSTLSIDVSGDSTHTVDLALLDSMDLDSLSEELFKHTPAQQTQDTRTSAHKNEGGDTGDLESLVGMLRKHINHSDWLDVNTPEKFESENPEIAALFKKPHDNQGKTS